MIADDLDAEVASTLEDLLSGSPGAIRACKMLARDIGELGKEAARELSAETIARLRVSTEGQEGLKAFHRARKLTQTFDRLEEAGHTDSNPMASHSIPRRMHMWLDQLCPAASQSLAGNLAISVLPAVISKATIICLHVLSMVVAESPVGPIACPED